MSSTAELLRMLRLKKDLTQEEVADGCNIALTSYARYELGMRQPKTEIAAKLANFFGVSMDELISGSLSSDANAVETERVKPTDDDIKFALFGGAEGVTDEDYEDVKRYAAFVKARKNGGSL